MAANRAVTSWKLPGGGALKVTSTAVYVPPVVPERPVALGYYSLNQPPAWNESTASGFAARFGRNPALIHTFVPIVDTTTPPSSEATDRSLFDLAWANDAYTHGAMPLYSHELRDHRIDMGVPQPRYTLAQWLSGANDAALIRWLDGAAKWGHPFLYRFGWEMTGSDYTWAVHFEGNTAGRFIDFWRYVVSLQRQHAPQGKAVWCPSVFLPANAMLAPMADCYPGTDWADYIGLDGYNTAIPEWTGPDKSFLQVFAASYAEVQRIDARKPVLICETGVNHAAQGVDSVAWLAGIPAALKQMPNIRGVCFFDNTDNAADFTIHNKPQKSAFTTMAHDPYMQGAL